MDYGEEVLKIFLDDIDSIDNRIKFTLEIEKDEWLNYL